MTQTTIKNLLNPENQTLQSLMVRIDQLKRWNAWLSECLPDETALLAHCQVVRLYQSSLIIIAENAHWATRFQYFIPQLIPILRRYPDFQGLQHIQCKICPPQYGPQVKLRKAKKLSKENAELFKEAAEKTEDPHLREILERISKNS